MSILFFGVGLFFYIGLVIALPREDEFHTRLDSRVLGVCSRLSRNLGMDVGLVRFITICVGELDEIFPKSLATKLSSKVTKKITIHGRFKRPEAIRQMVVEAGFKGKLFFCDT